MSSIWTGGSARSPLIKKRFPNSQACTRRWRRCDFTRHRSDRLAGQSPPSARKPSTWIDYYSDALRNVSEVRGFSPVRLSKPEANHQESITSGDDYLHHITLSLFCNAPSSEASCFSVPVEIGGLSSLPPLYRTRRVNDFHR